MSTLSSGILISIEGIDGAGKSTLVHNVHMLLKQKKFDILLTKEPGGSNLGKQLREILQYQKDPIDPKAEFLLFAADRAQHFSTIILPALAAHKIVISDRLADSSMVYQGYGRGLDKTMIQTINTWVMQQRTPDITFYLRIDSVHAQKRLMQRSIPLTNFEQEKVQFSQKLIKGFETLFKKRKNIVILEGNQEPYTIAQQAYSIILSWIQKHNLLK